MNYQEDGLVGKMITINTDEILFYEKWQLVKPKRFVFPENQNHILLQIFLYSNSQVWDYIVKIPEVKKTPPRNKEQNKD
jgi:hypothetical protein